MNEEVIVVMREWFKKVPKPSDKLYLAMWDEVEKQTLKKLETKPLEDVAAWLRSNFNDDPRNGPKWLNNVSHQTYAKLWSLRGKND